MQYQGSSISEGEPVRKMKKVSIPKATDSELDIFYSDLSKAKGKPVLLSLMPKHSDSYIRETEAGVLPKPLTDLHDPMAMKMNCWTNVKAYTNPFCSLSAKQF